ncbi:hypothetical protein [Sneathiella chinensis]|uniref:Uncharacterized protein n=1 Tax=Sneathiella chinensis TaxID=349750 RepID=A0ABQ5U2I5_9PROT|nr:hypothetical protein [Sneathiella chinensis]GLQ06038.1 hypothetical protein GCM10007924_12590 [Sneathiella chinensis]
MHWLVERTLVGRTGKQTIAKYAAGPDRFHGVLIIASAALLGVGIAAPFATVDGFFGLTGQFSLFQAILELMKAGQGVYAVGVAVVFMVVPVLIVATNFDLWYKIELTSDKFEKYQRRLALCGRLWFFVMLATIALVFYVRTSGAGGVLHASVYYLLLSVILQKLNHGRITRLLATVKFVD